MIEVQESSEPLATLDRPVVVHREGFGFERTVAHPLVVPFRVVVLNILPNHEPKMLLTKRDDVIETLATN